MLDTNNFLDSLVIACGATPVIVQALADSNLGLDAIARRSLYLAISSAKLVDGSCIFLVIKLMFSRSWVPLVTLVISGSGLWDLLQYPLLLHGLLLP